MWFSNSQGLQRAANGSATPTSTAYSILSGLCSRPAQILFLDKDLPEHDLLHMKGTLEEVTPGGLRLTLERFLPQIEDPSMLVLVEVAGPAGPVRFRCPIAQPVVAGTATLFLSLPEKIEQIQRRHFARAPFSGTITYDQLSGIKRFGRGQAIGVDLSGGGLKMVGPMALAQDQEILLSFDLPGGRPCTDIRATVIRVYRQGDQWAMACRFEGLSGPQEAALVQAVFRMQVRSPIRD